MCFHAVLIDLVNFNLAQQDSRPDLTCILKLAANLSCSGSVRWSVKLEGRVECSAAITGDFSEVT